MPGRYDLLREHLAAQDKSAGYLVMTREQIEELVGALPARAGTDAWWLKAAPNSAQAQAWLAAEWRPKSTSPGGVVVFVPTSEAPSQQPAQVVSQAPPAPAAPPAAGQKTTWRSLAPTLWSCAVAAVSAGLVAAISFTHLEWYATAWLTICIAAAAFLATQGFTAHGKDQEGRKWWAATAAVLLLIDVGYVPYHEWLDPATHPGLPFNVSVDPDPTSVVSPQGCRQIVLPGPWRNPAPPVSLLQQVVTPWEQSQHGVDAHVTYVAVFLQAKSDQAVDIGVPLVVVAHRATPLRGPTVQFGGGCGAEIDARDFTVNLDQSYPQATFGQGEAFPAVPTASGTAHEAQGATFQITDSDTEYFVVAAFTTRADVQWYLDIPWASAGQQGTDQIRYGSAPFETSAYNPSVNPTYTLLPGGTWGRAG